MILSFVLAALTLIGAVRVWEIILIAFFAGIVNAFDVPDTPGVSGSNGGERRPAERHRAEFVHL